MARTCSVCQHPNLGEINAALLEGASIDELAGKFPPLSRSSLDRHRASHLDQSSDIELIVARLEDQISDTEDLANEARSARSFAAAVSAKGLVNKMSVEVSRLKLQAAHSAVADALTGREDYQEAMNGILAALRPYPDASAAVLRAVQRWEGNNA